MKVKPLGDRILVKPLDAAEKTAVEFIFRQRRKRRLKKQL